MFFIVVSTAFGLLIADYSPFNGLLFFFSIFSQLIVEKLLTRQFKSFSAWEYGFPPRECLEREFIVNPEVLRQPNLRSRFSTSPWPEA